MTLPNQNDGLKITINTSAHGSNHLKLSRVNNNFSSTHIYRNDNENEQYKKNIDDVDIYKMSTPQYK
jgi:hypothetical protein